MMIIPCTANKEIPARFDLTSTMLHACDRILASQPASLLVIFSMSDMKSAFVLLRTILLYPS